MLDSKRKLLMKPTSTTIAKNSAANQSSEKYFSLALSRSLQISDVEAYEEISYWLSPASALDGVPRAEPLESSLALSIRNDWIDTPAKHRRQPSIPLPILFFDSEQDWLWHPEISPSSFSLDFLDGALGYRLARAESDSSPLRKALPKARETANKIIWDLCGGWRVDALLMAHWNYKVYSFEKSPWVHLLSARAIKRSSLLSKKELELTLLCQNALEFIDSMPLTKPEVPSIIYIDPMYPQTKSTALNQSEMRYLHHISSNEDIAEELLEKSLPLALDRVIIKRPTKAAALSRACDMSIEQGSTRYDIYIRKDKFKKDEI
jgi:16S rRNA (guanine1516-N2)-methyltransferase